MPACWLSPISQVRLLLKPWRQSAGTWVGRLASAAALSSGVINPLSPAKPQHWICSGTITSRAQARATASIFSPSPIRRLLQVIWSITVSSMGVSSRWGSRCSSTKVAGSNTRRPLPSAPESSRCTQGLVSSNTGQRPCSLACHSASASSVRLASATSLIPLLS